jgi:PPOX class probable F420-dependent enzyme
MEIAMTTTRSTTMTPPGLDLVQRRLRESNSLAVLVTTHPDRHEPQVAVVNTAVIDDPLTGEPRVAFVGRRGAKLANLRRNPLATLVVLAGWEWVAVAGAVELYGPDEADAPLDPEVQRQLLREIYRAAGGAHPDLAAYDRTMVDERRCAVLVTPSRIWTNPAGSEHVDSEGRP